MKLATMRNGKRDGKLVVVSRDMRYAVPARNVAETMIHAIENWSRVKGALTALYNELNANRIENPIAFSAEQCAAPLPRASQWLDASAFLNHGKLMEKAFDIEPIPDFDTIPLMYQGASDDFLGARDDIVLPSETLGIDFEAEVAVVVDNVPMAVDERFAASHIKLVMLVNDVSLRTLAPREMRTGFGFLQAKPSTAFSPVAVTPDELGEAWRDERVQLPMRIEYNGEPFGTPHGREMNFGFGRLIAHAAYTRRLRAGTIVGSGTFSNVSHSAGSACIAERRAIEILECGHPRTPFMSYGDKVKIEMTDDQSESVFGSIEQRVAPMTSADH
ncbi:fumarylacetoacetate hydrolase family protein [Paraburkholderia fungorum]